ncbi:MAG: hypothetical protein H6844_16945 [Alphaproteobacteria bacterium]|nr:hypothetical protein [Alphaproteobacteria bacterium]
MRLMRILGAGLALATLAGCAVPAAVTIASYAADGASLLTTGRSMSDHGLSILLRQDCALFRAVEGEPVCRPMQKTDPVYTLAFAPRRYDYPDPEASPRPPGPAAQPLPARPDSLPVRQTPPPRRADTAAHTTGRAGRQPRAARTARATGRARSARPTAAAARPPRWPVPARRTSASPITAATGPFPPAIASSPAPSTSSPAPPKSSNRL